LKKKLRFYGLTEGFYYTHKSKAMKRSITTVLFAILLLSLWSCSKKEASSPSPELPATPYIYASAPQYKIEAVSFLDVHLAGRQGQFIGSGRLSSGLFNLSSNNTATLGRVIFYDNLTSINLQNKCSGCHNAPVIGHQSGSQPRILV
jgi:hypothetical protein